MKQHAAWNSPEAHLTGGEVCTSQKAHNYLNRAEPDHLSLITVIMLFSIMQGLSLLLSSTVLLSGVATGNRERFDEFTRAYELVETDPGAHRLPFADDAVFEFCFRVEDEVPLPCFIGNYEETNSMFVQSIKTFRHKFDYVHGSQDKTIYAYSAYFETKDGCKSFYTESGWLEYNDEGKIIRQVAFSEDSGDTMRCVMNYEESAKVK